MNILILGENGIRRKNWGHQLFLNSFAKQHKVVYWGLYHPDFTWDLTIPQVISKYGKPDIILTYMAKRCYPFRSLADIIDIPKVHIEVDFVKREAGGYKGQYDTTTGYNRYKEFFETNKFSIMFARDTSGHNGLKEAKVAEEVFYLPFSVDIDIYKNYGYKRILDVMAVFTSFSKAYPRRHRTQRLLSKVGKKYGFKVSTREVFHDKYVDQLNRSKIFVTSNNKWGSLSMKYYEVMSCGTLLMADLPVDLDRVGFKDKKHLVVYDSLSDLIEKVHCYLKDPKTAENIAEAGMKFVRENHSNDVRIKQFYEVVSKEVFGGKI